MQHRHGRRQHPCRVGGRKPTTAAEHPTTLVTTQTSPHQRGEDAGSSKQQAPLVLSLISNETVALRTAVTIVYPNNLNARGPECGQLVGAGYIQSRHWSLELRPVAPPDR